MNDLTLPATFDMGAYEHNEDLRRAALRDKALKQAFRNAIWETQARAHFHETVMRNRHVERSGRLVAETLARLARLVEDNLEVDVALQRQFEADGVVSWPTAVKHISKLAEQDLIEILARGQSASHNYHIRLFLSDNARREIDRRANEEIGFRLLAEEQRSRRLSPILP